MTASPESCYEFAPFQLDPLRRVLWRDSKPVPITSMVFDTLLLLIENQGTVLTKDRLIKSLWPDKFVEEAGLTQNIAVLRKTLGESPDEHHYIVTVPGRGYCFVCPVRKPAGAGVQPALSSPEVSTSHLNRQRRPREITLEVLLVMAAGIGLTLWLRSPEPPEVPLVRFAFTPGHDVLDAVISPNGRHIAYVAGEGQGKLWVQDLDREEPREIEGTEGTQRPFWSPGSDFIGFSVGDELKKVSAAGGPVIALSQRPSGNFVGGTWSPDGASIVFSVALRRLYQVPAQGGSPQSLPDPQDPENPRRFWFPHFLGLEDSRRILMFAVRQQNESRIVVRDLNSGEETVLGTGSLPVYSPSGHVLYQASRSTAGIWALPFSAETLRASGEAFLVAERGNSSSVSSNGTLVYLDSAAEGGWQLVWRDRSGRKLGKIGMPQESISMPALSPDERQVAVAGLENGNQDIWIHHLARADKTRLTFDGDADVRPTWSFSGERLAFSSLRQRDWDIFIRRADGVGGVTPLLANSLVGLVTDWSADEFVLFRRDDPKTGPDLWYLQRNDNGSSEAVPFLQTPFAERAGKLSPDGRYVAYISDESGSHEVYVEEFPARGGKSQVSTAGGVQARWSRDGKELFYVEDGSLIAVSVTTNPNFSIGARRRLFQSAGLRLTPSHLPNYDVSSDGQRFVIPERVESEAPAVIRVVQNWFSEFENLPAAR